MIHLLINSHQKVTAISESKDLTSMVTTLLFGKLREHELQMNRLFVQESEDKHIKGIALKIAGTKDIKILVTVKKTQ